jgi:tRNA-dihydrouridine synthase B
VTGADALMIGRGAQGRPWIFREIQHFLSTGERLPEPTPAEIGTILLEHLDALYGFYGEAAGVRIARKHLGWYAAERAESAGFREMVNRATEAAEQRRLTAQYFEIPQLTAFRSTLTADAHGVQRCNRLHPFGVGRGQLRNPG